MSVKSQSRRIGRMLRRITKHPLPICMQMGKMIVQGRECLLPEKFPTIVSRTAYCSCCGQEYNIQTKEGFSAIRSYALTPGVVEKEYQILLKLQEVPPGTAVIV